MEAFPAPGDHVAPTDHQLGLRAAVAAYLGHYRRQTRLHTEWELPSGYASLLVDLEVTAGSTT